MVVKVIDDVVSKGYQNLIENTISSDNFDWNYITGLTFDDDSYTGFVKRIFFKDYEFRTPDTDLLLPLLYEAIDKYEKGLEIKELYRIIARMNLRGQNKSKHLPHVDLEYPHYTMVYYVNDRDFITVVAAISNTLLSLGKISAEQAGEALVVASRYLKGN